MAHNPMKRLALSRETIRNLDAIEMAGVAGGTSIITIVTLPSANTECQGCVTTLPTDWKCIPVIGGGGGVVHISQP